MDKEITLIIEEPEDKEEPLLVIDKEECLLEKAEKDIEREIQILQEQLALSKEIKRKRELHKEAQNKKIEALKAEMVAKTLQYNNEMANISTQIENLENNKIINIDQIMDTIDDSIIDLTKKKTRAVVKRRPLYEVIKSPTNFKTTIKGIEFICYTEDRGGSKTSTSIAKATFTKDNLNFKNIFQANPPINSGYHFGCRLVIKDNMIYASAGERGNGNIAQDPKTHVGKMIRINLDGSTPNNNPKFKGKNDWLGEIYQIGIRNPQGMTLSPFNGKIYISNHGAKGGDFFGEVKFGENYGWQIWCWGGVNYSGTKCGETDQWDRRFTKPLYTWSPSIAVSAVQIYKGDEFKEWNGHILMTSLKDETIRKLEFINENEVGREVIIMKGKLDRIRDLKIAEDGKIYILSNGAGALSVLKK